MNPSKPVPPEHAEKFAKCFSPGVIKVASDGEVSVDERNLRRETMSREVLRHKEFAGCAELKRIRDWFICAFPPLLSSSSISLCCVFVEPGMVLMGHMHTVSVESEGPYTPESLLPEAVKVMRGKIASIRAAAEALLADSADLGSGTVVSGPDADGDVEMGGE